MREDMRKLICERPRGGKAWSEKNHIHKIRRTKPEEDEVGGKKRGFIMDKYLNDYLSPLKRFLAKAAAKGRKWDDVYSEICEVLPKDSTLQIHVHDHLKYMVQKDVTSVDGELFDTKGELITRYYNFFWVDAETGILNQAKEKRPRYKEFHNTGVIRLGERYFYQYDSSLDRNRWSEPSIVRNFPKGLHWVEVFAKGEEELPYINLSYFDYSAKVPADFDISNSRKSVTLRNQYGESRDFKVSSVNIKKVFPRKLSITTQHYAQNGFYYFMITLRPGQTIGQVIVDPEKITVLKMYLKKIEKKKKKSE
jgi:hypothetical protein